MKKLLFSFILVFTFSLNASAHTQYKNHIHSLPQPLQESPGQIIYEEMGCAMCHGYQGGGDGFMADGLSPRPRDFTNFKDMSRISDMAMFHSIRNGIPGTAMPSWELSDQQIFDVISYVKAFLADSQMTISVCFNEKRKINVHNLNLGRNPKITIDRDQFVKVASSGNQITIQPKDRNVMRYLKKKRQKLMRTHVTIAGEGKEGNTALIAVRISDCFK